MCLSTDGRVGLLCLLHFVVSVHPWLAPPPKGVICGVDSDEPDYKHVYSSKSGAFTLQTADVIMFM